jgi:hypothetical protein
LSFRELTAACCLLATCENPTGHTRQAPSSAPYKGSSSPLTARPQRHTIQGSHGTCIDLPKGQIHAAASSLACSHPPPAPRVRVATPVLILGIAASSTPSPRTPDAVFTPVRGGRPGMSTPGGSFSVRFEGAITGSGTRWPLRGREKHTRDREHGRASKRPGPRQQVPPYSGWQICPVKSALLSFGPMAGKHE